MVLKTIGRKLAMRVSTVVATGLVALDFSDDQAIRIASALTALLMVAVEVGYEMIKERNK